MGFLRETQIKIINTAMQDFLKMWLFLIFTALVTGCAAEKPFIMASNDLSNYRPKTYFIMPLEDNNSDERGKANYPDAAITVRNALQNEFMRTGFKLVSNSQIQELYKKIEQEGKINEISNIEFAKMLGADTLITGCLNTYFKGYFALEMKYTTVSFSIEATDVKSKDTMWSANVSKSTPWTYDYDPAAFAQELVKKVVDELIEKGHKR